MLELGAQWPWLGLEIGAIQLAEKAGAHLFGRRSIVSLVEDSYSRDEISSPFFIFPKYIEHRALGCLTAPPSSFAKAHLQKSLLPFFSQSFSPYNSLEAEFIDS